MKKSNSKSTTRNQRKAVERQRLNPKLFIVPTVDDNPRREGSHGYKSMEIVLSARKPMTVEKFVAKKGRLRDLHWDANKGYVKLTKKAS